MIHCRKHPKNLDTAHLSQRKRNDREVDFMYKEGQSLARNNMLTDQLGDLVIIAVSGNVILI